MVAFIDDHLAVLGDAIVHDVFADETLNDRHVEQPGRLVAAAANAADRLGRKVEKCRQTLGESRMFLRAGNDETADLKRRSLGRTPSDRPTL